jgi:hypothetical protein
MVSLLAFATLTSYEDVIDVEASSEAPRLIIDAFALGYFAVVQEDKQKLIID